MQSIDHTISTDYFYSRKTVQNISLIDSTNPTVHRLYYWVIPEIDVALIYYSLIYKINPLKFGRAFFSTYGDDFATTRCQKGILASQFNKIRLEGKHVRRF